MSDDFYIGYEPEMPGGFARRIGATAALLLGGACVTAVTLVLAQAPFDDGVFEFGRERTFEGIVSTAPYPALRVEPESRRIWLVGMGKHGAAREVDGLDGRSVRVTGTLIERDGVAMLQVGASGVKALQSPAAALPAMQKVGSVSIDGEIVDGKCHLGVMKPGDGPVHRDCAVRCLLGGIPPLLVARDARGNGIRTLPLVDLDGAPSSLDLEPWVARPVRIRGLLYRRGAEEYVGFDAGGITLAP
jgi:hypothetical protein